MYLVFGRYTNKILLVPEGHRHRRAQVGKNAGCRHISQIETSFVVFPSSERADEAWPVAKRLSGREGGRMSDVLFALPLTHSLTLSAHSSSDVQWANGRSRLCVVNVIIQSDKFCCAIEPKERTGWTGAEA